MHPSHLAICFSSLFVVAAESEEKAKSPLSLNAATAIHLSLAKTCITPGMKCRYSGYLSRSLSATDVRDYSTLQNTWIVTYSPEDKGQLDPILFRIVVSSEKRADSVFSYEADGTLLYLSVSIPGDKTVDDPIFPSGVKPLSKWNVRALLTKQMGCRELK